MDKSTLQGFHRGWPCGNKPHRPLPNREILLGIQTSVQNQSKNAVPEASRPEVDPAQSYPRGHRCSKGQSASSLEGAHESRQMHARAALHVAGALLTLSAQSSESKVAHSARAQNTPFNSKMKGS